MLSVDSQSLSTPNSYELKETLKTLKKKTKQSSLIKNKI